MHGGRLQGSRVEAIFTAQVALIDQINENGPEFSERGKGIDMVCVETKFDLLHVLSSNRESYTSCYQSRLVNKQTDLLLICMYI